MFDIDKAIANRSKVRIIWAGGRESLLGVVGILMGYSPQYHTFKVGFIDSSGKYTGEKTVVGFNSIELVDDAPACVCTDYHTLDCLEFQAARFLGDTDTEENNDVTIKDGPLTERQVHILNHLRAGKRHEEIAPMLAPVPGHSSIPQAVTVNVVKQECQNIRVKFGTSTVMQAASIWATAQAYREAAALIEADRPLHPESDDADNYVNHVLDGLAQILRERAERLTPR